MKYLSLLTLCALPAFAFGQVPVVFQPGTPAVASEVNENFQSLDARIKSSIGSVIISGVTASDGSGVAGAVCPADRIAISANCSCDNGNGTRNFGILFACQVAGNGGAAGCFNEPVTFDPSLPSPMATIVVGCASALQNDGTPIDPVPIVLKDTSSIQSGVETKSIIRADASDALDQTLKSIREQVSDHQVRLQQN